MFWTPLDQKQKPHDQPVVPEEQLDDATDQHGAGSSFLRLAHLQNRKEFLVYDGAVGECSFDARNDVVDQPLVPSAGDSGVHTLLRAKSRNARLWRRGQRCLLPIPPKRRGIFEGTIQLLPSTRVRLLLSLMQLMDIYQSVQLLEELQMMLIVRYTSLAFGRFLRHGRIFLPSDGDTVAYIQEVTISF